MAKQIGDIMITGTIDSITFYRMEGKFYARKKSALSRKKFLRADCFEGSRRSAARFSEGNRLASRAYRTVDKDKRVYSLFCFLKTRAIALLKQGKKGEEVMVDLVEELKGLGLIGGLRSDHRVVQQGRALVRQCDAFDHRGPQSRRREPQKKSEKLLFSEALCGIKKYKTTRTIKRRELPQHHFSRSP